MMAPSLSYALNETSNFTFEDRIIATFKAKVKKRKEYSQHVE